MTPGKSDQDTRPLESKDLFAFLRTGKGRESRRAKVQGHNQVQSLENPAALLSQGLAGEEQAGATLCKISVYSTPFMNSRNSVKRGHVCVSSESGAKDGQEGTWSSHPLTVIVDSAVIVLVTVLHELLNVIFCNGLACGLQHHLQFI